MEVATVSAEEKLTQLQAFLKRMGPTLVAFSGGVDSSFLLAVAAEVLREQVTALMTLSPSTPPEDASHAHAHARALGVRLLTIRHDELAIPQYAANPTNRCYFCKNSLYEICRREAERLSIQAIVDGVNLDDLQDYRPGLRAAEEYGVIHPLVEVRFNKSEIRQGSKLLGLTSWDKPASPCLSSRVPYGTPITAHMLAQVSHGESFLRSLGFREVRVRHHGASARIEIREEDLGKVSSPRMIHTISEGLKKLGFDAVLLDLAGYRSGVFNEGLQKK